jgi:hypothetical protein
LGFSATPSRRSAVCSLKIEKLKFLHAIQGALAEKIASLISLRFQQYIYNAGSDVFNCKREDYWQQQQMVLRVACQDRLLLYFWQRD